MANPIALEKLLNIQELEKQKAQKDYQQSMDDFEAVATTLYHLLKKKEDLENEQENMMQQSISIDELKSQMTYIENLNLQINHLQNEVVQARSQMEEKQEILTDAHVEVKKFEKIIEFRKREEIKAEKELESKTMDEISIQQFISRKSNR